MQRVLSFGRKSRTSDRDPNVRMSHVAESAITFEAQLKKRSLGTRSAFKNWRTRWLVLRANGLLSWHKERSAEPVGTMQLGIASTAVSTSAGLSVMSGESPPPPLQPSSRASLLYNLRLSPSQAASSFSFKDRRMCSKR